MSNDLRDVSKRVMRMSLEALIAMLEGGALTDVAFVAIPSDGAAPLAGFIDPPADPDKLRAQLSELSNWITNAGAAAKTRAEGSDELYKRQLKSIGSKLDSALSEERGSS